MLEVREEAPADLAGVRRVHDAAFQRGAEGALVDALRDAGLIVASVVTATPGTGGDRIVGNAVFSRIRLRSDQGITSALALAPVAVAPVYQSRGIGTRIIRYGIAACAQRGYGAVLVLGDPRYYERFGFSSELARHVASPYSDLGEHWMALELGNDSLPSPCEALYPAPFLDLD